MFYIGTGGFPQRIANKTNKINAFNGFQWCGPRSQLEYIENIGFICFINYFIRETDVYIGTGGVPQEIINKTNKTKVFNTFQRCGPRSQLESIESICFIRFVCYFIRKTTSTSVKHQFSL